MRRDPSRLRFPQRERRIRAAMRRGRNHLRRPAPGDTRTLGRQAAGPIARRALRSAGDGGQRRPRQSRAGARVSSGARPRRRDDDQGDCRRRWTRHASGKPARRARRRIPAMSVRGARGLYGQWRGVRRTVDAARTPPRGADHRRSIRLREPSLGTRVHNPAAQSKAGRGRAQPRTRPRATRSAHSRGNSARRGSPLRQSGYLRVPG